MPSSPSNQKSSLIRITFYALLISSFFQGVFILPSISIFKILFFPLFFVTLITVFLPSQFTGFKIKTTDVLLLLFLIYGMAGCYWSIDYQISFDAMQKVFLIILLFLATEFLVFNQCKNGLGCGLIHTTNKIIFCSGIILAISVILDDLNLISFKAIVAWQEDYRSVGFLGRPNFGAGILNICFAFMIPFYKNLPRRLLFLGGATIIYAIAILFTSSRMGILLFGINIILIFASVQKVSRNLIKTTAVILIFLILSGVILLILQQYNPDLYLLQSSRRLFEYFTHRDNAPIERLEILKFGSRLLADDPSIWVRGIGLNSFLILTEQEFEIPHAAHNLYLEILLGLGLLGLILFICFQLKIFSYAQKLWGSQQNSISRIHFVPFVNVTIIIFFEYLFLSDLWVNKIVWIIYGIICGFAKYSEYAAQKAT